MTNLQLPSGGNFLATSEAMTPGHPDKIADQVVEAIIDACLEQDPESILNCSAVAKTGMMMLFGNATTNSSIDVDTIVRSTIKNLGYDSADKGLDYKTMDVFNRIDLAHRSQERCLAPDTFSDSEGMVFGYATNETSELVPLSQQLATKICQALWQYQRKGSETWVRPDGKAQVTVEYSVAEDGSLKPVRVHSAVVCVQHAPDAPRNDSLVRQIKKNVIYAAIPATLIDANTTIQVNPSGRFVIGGPRGDAGVSGRQGVADSCGAWGPHGNGVPIGKDGFHVERCGTYAARWAAKSLVHAGFASRCCVQLAYAKGLADPLSVSVDSYGSVRSGLRDQDLCDIIKQNFDFRPGALVKDLQLEMPKFLRLAVFGHGEREDPELGWSLPMEWEQCKTISSNVSEATKLDKIESQQYSSADAWQ